MTTEEVIELFSYPPEMWDFPGLEEYSRRMETWLERHEPTADQLLRYMLIGLWVDYRATNHHGEDFMTDPDEWNWEPMTPLRARTRRQLDVVNERLGRPITSTDDYLALLVGKPYEEWDEGDRAFFGTDNLFQFVLGREDAA